MKIFGTPDERTIKQLQTCLEAEAGAEGVLCADAHVGYSMPIGGVVAYEKSISPSGVGYDIGCGNMAVKTALRASDLNEKDWQKIAVEINNEISFGMGRKAQHVVSAHPVFDRIEHCGIPAVVQLLPIARSQLGTVGSGNHYVDVLTDSDGAVWVANHFGSRGFGHKTATGFMNLGLGRGWDEGTGQGEMDSPPILLPLASAIGQDYKEAMEIAGEYAKAGREVVINEVLEILGTQAVDVVHNHHNFAWAENGKLVVRKGATPLFPNQRGFVGGSMGDWCVVVRGVDHPTAQAALFSAMHGAGRVLSRRQAAGKVKRKQIWQCGDRKCEFHTITILAKKMFRRGPNGERPICPKCGGHLNERAYEERLTAGVVDWDQWKQHLKKEGIILVGGGADEAPPCYRPLNDVLNAHAEYVQVEVRMRPKIVVMAGSDVVDFYKD